MTHLTGVQSMPEESVTILNGTNVSMRLDAKVAPGSVLVPSAGNVVVPRNFWTAWTAANWDNQALLTGQLAAV
jgi:hypothetical protein